jgi:hypothetical protein
MKLTNLRLVPWLVATLLLVVAWAVVISVAVHVSEIVLRSLEMIVELAALPPG